MSDQEYARTPDIPTLYLLERGPRGWDGVATRCGHCRPAGLLTVLDDRLSCLQCGRDAAKVLPQRPRPVPAFTELPTEACLNECGRTRRARALNGLCNPCNEVERNAGRSTPRPPAVRKHCACGKRIKPDASQCGACYTAERHRQATENRPPCEVCGKPTTFGGSARYCGSHLAMKKRGTLPVALQRMGVAS